MEEVLLCYSLYLIGTFGEAVGVHFLHYTPYPHVNGESLSFIKAVKQRTFGNLCAYALDFLQLFSAEFNGFIFYFFKINLIV